MNIGIIDYGLGNLTSVSGAVKYLGHNPVITDNGEALALVDKVILPGVGAFADGMRNLKERRLVDILRKLILEERKPLLAICLGFQLLARESLEFGIHTGLGWIDARVERIQPGFQNVLVPHVGWNDLLQCQKSILWEGIPHDSPFYYVHSFHVVCAEEDIVIGTCKYGECFVAAVQRGNIYATQFHPEKSQQAGLTLLKNFIEKS